MTPDQFNGLLESAGSIMLWANVYRLHQDKRTHGVTWHATAFFMFWGLWNLAFYHYYGLFWSLAGAISLVLANAVWLAQMVYYKRRNLCI